MNRTLLLLVLTLATGCASLPTVNHCDEVTYQREGNKIHIEAECRIPMEEPGMQLSPSEIMMGILAAMMVI